MESMEEDMEDARAMASAGPGEEEATTTTRGGGEVGDVRDDGADADEGDDVDAEEKMSSVYGNMARVKIYRLNERGHWDDKGTGFATCEYLEVRGERVPSRLNLVARARSGGQ